MRVLLINPNRYRFPPVIPVGIEYISGSLLSQGIQFSTLDLCFTDKPEDELHKYLKSYDPRIAAISVRQTDTVLYHQNIFFLPEIKNYTLICKSYGCITVLGGSGFSVMPEEIMKYTGADYGIYGPGEYTFCRLIHSIENGTISPKILNGYKDLPAVIKDHQRTIVSDYDSYLSNDGIVGFRTQIGCNETCIFCTESDKKPVFHDPENVGREIALVQRLGYDHFHLCDSEFNQNTEHCIDVCKAISSLSKPVRWTLYMKPEPFNEDIFRWLHRSGAYSLTLSLDTHDTSRHFLGIIQNFLILAKRHHLKVAIDLSTGYPYEDILQAQRMIDFLDRQPVETVGVNSFYRVFPGTRLYDLIRNHADMQQYLIKPSAEEGYLHPVFFNYFDLKKMKKLTENRKKFRIEGFEKATNYQRLTR